MKDKFKIIGAVIVFIVLVVSSIVLAMGNFTKTEEQEVHPLVDEDVESLLDEFVSDEDKQILTQEEQMYLVMGDFMNEYDSSLKLGDKDDIEYPEDKSNVLYSNLINQAQRADFVNMINQIEDLASKNKFHSEYNLRIGDIYHDATLMIATLSIESPQRGLMLKNMKDPNMLMIGTLLSPEISRRAVITNHESLSPIFDGEVVIKEYEVIEDLSNITDNYIDILLTETFSVGAIHKYYIELERNPLIAYVVEHYDGSLEFYSVIQDGDYECYYQNINYWIELDSKLNGLN